uniref:Uncharacterized protein n=2 Tax=Oryza TaxID=4527 RepID=Q6YWA9_ORYSJ|nr:hypothetical protein [Oryza sativa Japonica Group]
MALSQAGECIALRQPFLIVTTGASSLAHLPCMQPAICLPRTQVICHCPVGRSLSFPRPMPIWDIVPIICSMLYMTLNNNEKLYKIISLAQFIHAIAATEKGQKATDFFSDSLFTSAGRSGSGKAGCVGSRADQDGRLDGREVRDGGISSGGPRGNTGPSITVDTEMEQPRQLKGRPPQLGRMREVSSAAGGNDFRRFRGWRECEKCRPSARGIDFR